MNIHPTAVIHPSAKIASGVEIGPYCVVEQNVTVGEGCTLVAHVWVGRGTTLGKKNAIHAGAAIGGSAQHRATPIDAGTLLIGDGNTFREYVTVHRSTKPEPTRIGSNNYIMTFGHVGHDCVLEDNITIANATVLGGHAHVESGCTLSAGIAVHQLCRIGKMAMIGGQSCVTKDVPPFMMIDNNDECIGSLNLIGMKRGGLADSEVREVKKAYRKLYYGGLPIAEAAAQIHAENPGPAVRYLVDFIRSSKRGLVPHRSKAAGAEEPVL